MRRQRAGSAAVAYTHAVPRVVSIVASLTIAGTAASAGPRVRVSGSSLFADRTADAVSAQPGQNYLHNEVEPQVAVNPRSACRRVPDPAASQRTGARSNG